MHQLLLDYFPQLFISMFRVSDNRVYNWNASYLIEFFIEFSGGAFLVPTIFITCVEIRFSVCHNILHMLNSIRGFLFLFFWVGWVFSTESVVRSGAHFAVDRRRVGAVVGPQRLRPVRPAHRRGRGLPTPGHRSRYWSRGQNLANLLRPGPQVRTRSR